MIRILLRPFQLLLFVLCTSLASAKQPNIIVIFTDDHGWPDLGSVGIYDDLKTPHLDKMAQEGLRATDGYVTAPQCVPSRAGLLAGRDQSRFGVESNAAPLDGFDAQDTIAERLRDAGYATGMAGKWHLGPAPEITDHGFDQVFFKHSNAPGFWNMNLEGKDITPEQQRGGGYHLDLISDFACAFIERFKGDPFFFYLAYRAPHVPLDAPEKYLERFPGKMPERRRKALAMISAMDDGVGRIMETLRKHKIEENTLIFFIGDNGAPLKIHMTDAPGGGPGWDGSLNKPMNGEKGMLSEGGIRVPWLAYWKGTIPGGQIYDHPVTSLDVAATSIAVAGLDPDPQLDGVNLVPFLSGNEKGAPHDTLYWRWIAQSAIREGKWKLLVGGQRSYLFDLEVDPEELNDLKDKHPEVAQRLRDKLEQWAGELDPPGLTTESMAKTWEEYFDFYLEGKPAPPKPAAPGSSGKDWVVRNSTAQLKDGTLHVSPKGESRRPPFLAISRLKVRGPARLSFDLRSSGGQVGTAWRLDDQKDFLPEQTVKKEISGSEEFQKVSLEIPAEGRIIHLRVLFPKGESAIRTIEIQGDQDGRPITLQLR
jgi:uncharacterized sulfatase